jgi:hypothetical protein
MGLVFALAAVHTQVSLRFDKSIPAFTASLDAAVALVERVLPGWRIAEMKDGIPHEDGPYCHVRLWCPANSALGHRYRGNGRTPALAFLRALLSAKIEEDGHE